MLLFPSFSLDSNKTDLEPIATAASALIESEIEDVVRELRAAQRKSRRHFLWALLGVSPAALLPAIGLLLEGSEGLLVLLIVLVGFSQLFLGVREASKINDLKKALRRLREERDSAVSHPSTTDRASLDDPSRDA